MALFKKTTNLNEPNYPELSTTIADPTVERGSVTLDNSKQSSSKVQKLILAGGILIALIFTILAYMGFSSNDDSTVVEKTPESVSPSRANFSKEMDELMRQQPKPVVQESLVIEQPPQPSITVIQETHSDPNMPPPEPEPDLDLERRLSGNVLIGVDTRSPSSSSTQGGERESGRETTLGNRLASRTSTPSTVAKNRGDLTYLLRKGTNISCTLNTKIVTTHPGFTRCLVSKDVYSANGKVLLIERGSEIIGEQTTSMLQGQARVFVLWNTVETPNGVTLDIDSPTADSLGASGQVAQVDTHFWERFGGAIMLSLIDDGLVILGDRVNKGGSSVSYDSTSDTIESMAAEALKNTINIPPTGYVNQGTLVNVMVARDVDFKDVYELVDPYLLEGGKRHSLN